MSKQIGNIYWTNNDIINHLDSFLNIYNTRPIKNNNGGMGAPHCFATYFILKHLNMPHIIESGVWKGQSTWLIEKTCPNASLICIEPNMNNIYYKSNRAQYIKKDWITLNLTSTKDTVCFFDDHQNAVERIKHAVSKGYKHLIFEDNYPTGQGDCVSLKQSFDKNDDIALFLEEHIEIYYEFPPVFKTEITRWGDKWDNYPTPSPIFNTLDGNEKYKIFYDDAQNYTWLAYVKLK